jgi:hypothetical protein
MTTEASSRSPEPEEVLRQAFSYFLGDTHTALPARVEEYYPDEQKIDAKPLIKRRVVGGDGSELLEELPIIPDVPVAFPRNANFFLTFPLAAGDLVLLVFAERSLDKWLASTGEDTDPDEFRMHDLSDAVALPGLYPFSSAIKDVDKEGMALGHDKDGMQIHITQDKVEITSGGATVEITGKDSSAEFKLGDGAVHAAIVENLETLWGQLKAAIDVLDTHIHTTTATVGATAVPGVISPTTTPANAPSWDSSINSSKVSFPDG